MFLSVLLCPLVASVNELKAHVCKCELVSHNGMCWWRWRGGGVTVVVQLTNRSRGEGKEGFCGFLYLPLIKQLWQRPGSDKGRGQVWFSAQLLACQPITAAGLKAAHCLSASRTSHRKWLIRGELGWLHRTVTYKRGVMSLVLMYVDQVKLMSSNIQLLSLNNIAHYHFSVEDPFLFLPPPPARSCMLE